MQFRCGLNKHSFVLLFGRLFHRIAPLAGGAEEFEPGLDAANQRGSLYNGSPDGFPQSASCLFHSFHRAGQNLIDMDQLHSQPLQGFAEDAIHFLRLASRHSRKLGSVRDDARDSRGGIFDQKLHAGKNWGNARIRSAIVSSTRAAVRRSWRNRAISTIACRTTAVAVTITKNGIQLSMNIPRYVYCALAF